MDNNDNLFDTENKDENQWRDEKPNQDDVNEQETTPDDETILDLFSSQETTADVADEPEAEAQTEQNPKYANSFNEGFYQGDYSQAQRASYQNPYQNQNQNQNQSSAYNPYGQYGYGYGYQPEPPTKNSKKGKRVLSIILAVVVIIASIGIGTAIGRSSRGESGTLVIDGSESTTGDSASLDIKTPTKASNTGSGTSAGIVVANKARSSVVGVVVYDKTGELAGEGSGVVMGLNDNKDKTYVITCAHVVSDSTVSSVGILLEDGTVYDAKIVGFDERTDIGVVSVDKTNLTAAEFGDASALQVGEDVYAIGNPGGSEYYGSVTNGIVSALDRSITSTYTMNVIQHTAAISPGNSGGALVNSSGQVIGINSSKIAATDYEGIGFAVPITVAKPVVEALVKYGYVPDRPKLGISYASVSNYQAYSMVVSIKGLPAGSVIIASLSDENAFEGTDVQVGDMITAVNGIDLDKSSTLLDEVEKSKVGDKIKLSIARINARTYEVTTFDVTVKLVEDKGSKAEATTEESTQSYYERFYGDGNGGGQSDDFEEFFRQFFGSGF